MRLFYKMEQSVQHVFHPTYDCNHSSAKYLYIRVYLLQDIELAGYVANHFDLKQKSTMHKIKLHIKSNFDIDKTLIALKVKVKVIAWPFYPITLKKTEWQFSFAFQIELKGFQI